MTDVLAAYHSSASVSTIYAFFALQLLGAAGMTLIFSTALFSSQVKRLSTWYTFCVSWIISCLAYCILLFSNPSKVLSSTEFNTKNICVTQAALVYSVPTLTALTTLFLLVHSWYNVHFGLAKPPLESHTYVLGLFLVIPFVGWFLIFIGFLSYGLKYRHLAFNYGMYCTLGDLMPAKVSSLFVIIITFSTIPLQVSLGLSLLQNFDRSDARSTMSVQTLKMVIRVLVFSFLILIGFAEALIHLLTTYDKPAVDIILALLPVAGVLIFGIQKDLFQAWKGCFPFFKLPSTGSSSSHRSSKNEMNFGMPLARINGGATH